MDDLTIGALILAYLCGLLYGGWVVWVFCHNHYYLTGFAEGTRDERRKWETARTEVDDFDLCCEEEEPEPVCSECQQACCGGCRCWCHGRQAEPA